MDDVFGTRKGNTLEFLLIALERRVRQIVCRESGAFL